MVQGEENKRAVFATADKHGTRNAFNLDIERSRSRALNAFNLDLERLQLAA